MHAPLVSIIIPVYNVEPYIRRCVYSVINQTYNNLEIILVNDGSNDNSPQICDELAKIDKRIIVIHKKNGGLSDARNAGLDICRGEFISFIDSDDWVNENFIKTLLSQALKLNADIIIGENIRTDGIIPVFTQAPQTKLYSAKEALLHLFSQNHVAFVISCGKLYKRNLFSSLRFPIGKYHEDEFTTYILFYKSKKIVYTTEILYYYYQRAGSIVSTRHPWDVLEYLEQRYLFFKEKQERDLLPYLLPPLCWQFLCAYWHESHQSKDNASNYLKQLRIYVNDFNFIKAPLFHTFFLRLFAKYPKLYLFYRHFSPINIRKNF